MPLQAFTLWSNEQLAAYRNWGIDVMARMSGSRDVEALAHHRA
jgi:hypothetical protein